MTNRKRSGRKARPATVIEKTDSALADVYSKKTVSKQKEYKTISVSGSLHALDRNDKDECVLYIATNPSHIEMACSMSESSQYESYIYSEAFDFYDLSLDYHRASFINSLAGVAAVLKRVTRVVTYIGQVNSNIYKQYRSLLSAILKLELPIIELPHGLIQSGYNLDDDSRFIDLSSFYDGIGKSLPSVASLRLTWHGVGSVGYPRHNNLKNFKPKVVPVFTLITTNTNWYLYSVEDKRNFFNILFRYAEENHSRMFIWSPHPAEYLSDTFSQHVAPLRPANVLIYGLTKDIFFDGIEGSNDLIAYCADGISTVSTCLLEYEIHKKSVNVFSTQGVEQIVKSFSVCKTFDGAEQLRLPSKPIVTGMLEDYDPLKFDECLKAAPNSDPKNSIYLDLA